MADREKADRLAYPCPSQVSVPACTHSGLLTADRIVSGFMVCMTIVATDDLRPGSGASKQALPSPEQPQQLLDLASVIAWAMIASRNLLDLVHEMAHLG